MRTTNIRGMKLRHGIGLLFWGILRGAYGFLDQIQKAAGEAEEAVGAVGISLGGLG